MDFLQGFIKIDLMDQFQKGGWAMWPLLLAAVVGVGFILERLIVLFFQTRKLKPQKFLRAFDESMQKNQGDKEKVIDEMVALCKKKKGICAEIMLEGITKFRQGKAAGMGLLELKQWITNAIEERSRIELPQLEAHLLVLSVVATVAPLIGLLGTVSGMITSFTVMANSAGGAKPNELAGGISEALITTAAGLIIAIPVLVSYNGIRSSIDNFVKMLEEASIYLVDTLIVEKKIETQD